MHAPLGLSPVRIRHHESDTHMICVESLSFQYGKHAPVFEGFNWSVDQGHAWAILGPSGCGKTTLLYLLAGLRNPTSGIVSISGAMIRRPRPETGLILQDHGLLPWATIHDNVRLGFRIRRFYGPDGRHAPSAQRMPRGQEIARVDHWLARLGISEQAHKYPGQLSGGQRQRAAIGRTLALQPDLLLMDEPFSALDAPTREDLQNLIAELRREAGLTSVLVTHSIEEAAFLGEHILILRRPPTREALVIHNPGAGQPSYRSSSAYTDRMRELRSLIGDAA